jgi:hypothetical protein
MLTLTPQARAIAAAALGFALVAGWLSRIGTSVMLVVTQIHDMTARTTGTASALITAIAGLFVLVLARGAARDLPEGRDRSIAQAAQLVTAAGIVITLLTALAAAAGRLTYPQYFVG